MELKNIFSKKVLTLLSASILFCGCEDFLTRDHPTAITDDDFGVRLMSVMQHLDNVNIGHEVPIITMLPIFRWFTWKGLPTICIGRVTSRVKLPTWEMGRLLPLRVGI